MDLQLIIIFIIGIITASIIGSSFMKATTRGFSKDPAESYYKGEAKREDASQRAADIAERQRRMMEVSRERMERNKF